MQNSIISNFQPGGHGEAISRILHRADEVFIAVAFFKMSGLALLRKQVASLCNGKSRLTFILGTDFFLTDPDAVQELYETLHVNARARIYLFERSAESVFHPKYYRATSGSVVTAILGSGNITAGGLSQNIELSGYFETKRGSPLAVRLSEIEKRMLDDPRCRVADRLKIEHYKRQHAIWASVIKQASADATKRTAMVTSSSVLEDFLARYLADADHQANSQERTKNYETARQLVARFAASSEQTQSEFASDYGRLVGEAGLGRLWHSGSIHRSKKRVIASFRKVKALVAEVERNLHRPTPDLFALVQERRRAIPGLGPNIATEILHTYDRTRFPVLNKNPLTSLRELGLGTFPDAGVFSANDYAAFTKTLEKLAEQCGFPDLGRADHFLNFVFWKLRAKRTGVRRKQGLPTAAPSKPNP